MRQWHMDMSLNSEVDVKLSGHTHRFEILVFCCETSKQTD